MSRYIDADKMFERLKKAMADYEDAEMWEKAYAVEYAIALAKDYVITDSLLSPVVTREEYERLLKRFRHLLESDFIRSFDEVDSNHNYKRDIKEADNIKGGEYQMTKLGGRTAEAVKRPPQVLCGGDNMMTNKRFKEKLIDKLEDVWYGIQGFFEEWGKMIIAMIITIALVVGVVTGGYALIYNDCKKDSIKKWNNGICTECGGKYELYTISRGVHYYVCENCKHEIDCLGAMK